MIIVFILAVLATIFVIFGFILAKKYRTERDFWILVLDVFVFLCSFSFIMAALKYTIPTHIR
ncbi:hypothetical protein Psfp_04212 [Pelotomaculum sp. FP]|uniref:hypothetical protein n=1 Tax=Pelotomaculum sp. FP TaxID=261474 RepID=UPI00106557F2|nr:hypothetical protein [Pelotomaculum sp. FP]TEB10086.1 hypothetical protein Psfp_04212 [Pelotomaculum sp. FP]